VNLSSLKSSVFWVEIYAKNSKKITKTLILGLRLLLKIVKKNRKISRDFGLFSFNFFDFFKNYLGCLKIKEAADTLGIVCFFLQCETFWMVCLGQGWYPKGMHKNAWYLKGFLALLYLRPFYPPSQHEKLVLYRKVK